jgi:enoyl-[acyl-carrier protein] reductase I
MGFLAGKRLLITGVLNNRSIAYGIARACHREGAELAFSYQGERFKDRITENFRIAHEISAYSFPAMAKAALPRLRQGAALLTLSYLGAVRYVPNYNTMGLAKASLEASVRFLAQSLGAKGVRVNGISAGPIKTLAASGIKDFGKLQAEFAANAPIRRNITIDDVGNAAAFLLSDLAAGISSEIVYVDGGFSQVGIGSRDS